jgi:hypothetical protein
MAKEIHRIVWRGIAVDIGYDPVWLNLTAIKGSAPAHLELRAVEPERAPLPVTETGYRSHFTTSDIVANAGGPAAYVVAWLDREATWPERTVRQAKAAQLSLF